MAGSFVHVDADAQSIAGKEKERGAWLGVRLKVEKTETVVDGKKEIKEESKGGAVVDGVVDDSPAEKAGLKKGDVIVNFGDKTIVDADELMKAVRESTPGSKVKLTTLRDGKKSSVDVELAEGKAGEKEKRVITRTMRVPNAPRSPMPPTPPMIWHGKSGGYGFSLNTLNKQLAEYFGAPEGKGVLVEKVDEDSDAAKAGFKAGDVISPRRSEDDRNSERFQERTGSIRSGRENSGEHSPQGIEADDRTDGESCRKGVQHARSSRARRTFPFSLRMMTASLISKILKTSTSISTSMIWRKAFAACASCSTVKSWSLKV
ncbi:MAG: PDZ domain-containing protein [Desulfobacterales bacterium]|nr:PDZ domain-containing protein [Desulfobacterales bacterium]